MRRRIGKRPSTAIARAAPGSASAAAIAPSGMISGCAQDAAVVQLHPERAELEEVDGALALPRTRGLELDQVLVAGRDGGFAAPRAERAAEAERWTDRPYLELHRQEGARLSPSRRVQDGGASAAAITLLRPCGRARRAAPPRAWPRRPRAAA